MKKNILALAFMVMLASTTAFADGETGHGRRNSDQPPPPASSTQADSSNNLLDQVLNAIYAIIA